MFLVIKKRVLIISAVIFAVIIAAAAVMTGTGGRAAGGAAKKGFGIAIDAGHGGIDGGVTGVATKVKESDLNLAVTKKLENYLLVYGANVTLTRKNQDGLYGLTSKNRKRHDMEKRKQIIGASNADIVISIHMNSFPQQAKQRGAQVFYNRHSEKSKALAEMIRLSLSKNIEYCDRSIMTGDYYILECTDKPAVIVECGFLSNAADEALLITRDYQEKLAYYIFCAAVAYLEW